MMLIGGICGWREQTRLWIYPLEASVRFYTDKEMMRVRMAMLDMAEAFDVGVDVSNIRLAVSRLVVGKRKASM
jgi:hypothetical protein